ncbi:MAG: TetR-like C-terminal domain-containing protein, partial [Actinomycetota bacterium]
PIESLRLARATMRPLFDTLDRGVEAGVFVGDPSEIATHLWAAGHGHISLEIHGFVDQDDAAFERLVGRMVHAHRT